MKRADLGLVNLRIRISTKGDDREKGSKIIRNLLTDNKKLESKKKRGSDDDFKVDAGKEKRRRIMDYCGGLTQDCERVFPAPPKMIHRDCQKKPKSHESWEQGCLRNRGGRDCQDMKNSTPPLQKEKESCCRSDHSSRATIDEGCTTSLSLSLTIGAQLSPTKALRAAQLKKRYAHLIFKANHQAVQTLDGPLKQQQERERLQKQEIAEKARIEEEIKAAQTLLRMRAEAADPQLKIQRQREREAARIALEKMEKTVEFNDALQIMRDFESLLNATAC